MVLPAPPPDDAPGEGAWLRSIRRELSLTSGGLLVLVDNARPERLRDLVLALLPEYPALDVHTDMEDVYRVPEGAVMVLAPRVEDADWLNSQRPVFARRALKVILWCDAETSEALATRAVDFFDWISHRHECPVGVPLHGVFGIRAALCARAPGIVWMSGDLEACFHAALPGRELVHLSAKRLFSELVKEVRGAGRRWIVWNDINEDREGYFRVQVIEQAMEDAGRRSRVITEESRNEYGVSYGMRIHGKCASVRQARNDLAKTKAAAPGRLAALAGLEPEVIPLLVKLLRRGEIEQTLVQVLRETEDPGAAVARMAGTAPDDYKSNWWRHESPPMLRAFLKDRRVGQRYHFDKIRNSLAWSAIRIALQASFESGIDEAEALAKRAVEVTNQVYGPRSADHAHALGILAEVSAKRGHFREAEKLIQNAFNILEEPGSGSHASLYIFDITNILIDVLARQGRYEEAEDAALRAVEMAKRTTAAHWPNVQEVSERLQKIRALRAKQNAPP